MTNQLQDEFARIAREHQSALKARVARGVLGSSVIRVFTKGTKPSLLPLLAALPAEDLRKLNANTFPRWYEHQLDRIVSIIAPLNASNRRVHPGLKWGHAAKVLSLFLRDIVLHTRFFDDGQVERISGWLYVPIDSVVIDRLGVLGIPLPFEKIREIDSAKKFHEVQDLLAREAVRAAVPRVWFDDNWADRVRAV